MLKDGRTLADYGVKNNSTLHFAVRFHSMRMRVLELDMEVSDTVGRIKERVEEAEGVPVACQRVSYKAEELDDCRTLASYDAMEFIKVECRRRYFSFSFLIIYSCVYLECFDYLLTLYCVVAETRSMILSY
jgi:hypothetical protein